VPGQLADAAHGAKQLLPVSTGQVGPPDAEAEQGVTGEDNALFLAVKANAAGGMAGGLQHLELDTANAELLAFAHELQVEVLARLSCKLWGEAGWQAARLEERQVSWVQVNWRGGKFAEWGQCADVVKVRVGEQDSGKCGLGRGKGLQDSGGIIGWVDDYGFAAGGVDITIGLERAEGQR
jgi:hypothetical protein